MSKILVNNNAFDVEIADTGVTVAQSSSYTIPPQNYPDFAASSDVIVAIANGVLVLNDGGNDITDVSRAIDIIKGWCPGTVEPDTEPFFFDFSDVITGDDPQTLLTYTVPDGQSLSLSRLEISCRIESFIQVFKNGEAIGDSRTGAAKPSASFTWYPNRGCLAGDIIEVVLTKRIGTSDVSVGAHLMGTTTLST
jgi:hypothetical protein